AKTACMTEPSGVDVSEREVEDQAPGARGRCRPAASGSLLRRTVTARVRAAIRKRPASATGAKLSTVDRAATAAANRTAAGSTTTPTLGPGPAVVKATSQARASVGHA